ncbi:MAG: 50S ribosomal protein L3 N(5)-glutamine methyltransferase [Wenzhouxiangellaceae bacterium]|nr:50S ribosomal protein L3 N(5)-glutamine methyltransferase [Wenzhouxiangellaceae bacterium]
MSTANAENAPETIGDWVRAAAERMDEAGLFFGHGTGNAIDEASWMVAHELDLSPDFDDEMFGAGLGPGEREALDDLLERRIDSRKPLAYLIGEAWFAGLRFRVDERALVPRSPLAELVVSGLRPWLELDRPLVAIDVGTGCGCIGAAMAWHWPSLRVDAVDVSGEALDLARENVRRLGVADRVRVLESDLFEAVGDARYDLVVSNPPYVPAASMEELPDEYRHEPRGALEAGDDGLDIVRRLLREAPEHLTSGGFVLCEVGEARPAAEALLADTGAIWLEFEHGGDGVFLIDRPGCLALREASP